MTKLFLRVLDLLIALRPLTSDLAAYVYKK